LCRVLKVVVVGRGEGCSVWQEAVFPMAPVWCARQGVMVAVVVWSGC